MRTFYIHPLAAAIILSVLCMGVVGLLVAFPIVCINWFWNDVVAQWMSLPTINVWQSSLLYLAVACIIYIAGFVRIEIKAETVD